MAKEINTIILPGFSLKNKNWAYKVKEHIPNSAVYEWKHWRKPEFPMSIFNPDTEAENIANIRTPKFSVIAKSIGTLVSMKLINKGYLPKRLILCGIPLSVLGEEDKQEYIALKNLNPNNTLVIQNSNDPYANSSDIENFLSKINKNITVKSVTASNHDYPYYEEFTSFLLPRRPLY